MLVPRAPAQGPSALYSLVCHLHVCTRLALYHICIGFQCLATTSCLVLIGLRVSEPLNIYLIYLFFFF